MGFIVNKPLDEPTLSELFDQLNLLPEEGGKVLPAHLARTDVYYGGPVEEGRGFVLHSPDYVGEDTMVISDEISLTATVEILRAIAAGRGPKKMLLTLGYASWAAGQLEDELSKNVWLYCDASAELVFDPDATDKYERTMATIGIDPRLLTTEAGHA